MNILRTLSLLLATIFLSPILCAQQVDIVPHYPASSYTINRLLPFSLKATGDIDIVSVSLQVGDGCKVFPDRYYNEVFHLYCTQIGEVSAEVVYMLNGTEKLSSVTPLMSIAEQGSPSSNPTPTTVPTGSLFNKVEGE